MKNILYLSVFSLLFLSGTYAQKYKRVALGISGGAALHAGDGEMNDPGPALGGNLKVSINNRLSLRAELGYIQTSAKAFLTPGVPTISTTTSTDFNPALILNMANFKRRSTGLPDITSALYGGLGLGLLQGKITYDVTP